MTLTVDNPDRLDLDGFISEKLIPEIQEVFPSMINDGKLISVNDFINNTLKLSPQGRWINVKDVLLSAIYNLVYTKMPNGSYVISIDSNQIVPDTRAKIIEVAQLVNYGNMSVPSYPIFDEVFRFFADNLNDLYIEYVEEG